MVDPNLLPQSLRGERHFRWRGGEVSRIEGLSDPVFALSLTLLVVAADRPLNLAQFLKNPTALRDHLLAEGCTTEMASLDEILSVVLPNSRETLWEYDARRVRVDRLWAFSG